MSNDGGPLAAPSGIRLVALDIDDTLIPWRGTLAAEVIEAMRAIRAAGVEVVLASGRGVSGVVPVAVELEIDELWALCSNGAVTVRIADGVATEHARVTFDLRGIVNAVRALDERAPVAIETSGIGFLVDGDPYEAQAPIVVGKIGEMPDAVAFLSIASGVVSVETFAGITAGHPVHAVPYPHENWVTIDIVSERAGKGAALAALAAAHGLAASECAAMGDYLNDIPMLEWAGWAVAMGQAPDAVKAVADAVAPAAADHGAAAALRALAASAQL